MFNMMNEETVFLMDAADEHDEIRATRTDLIRMGMNAGGWRRSHRNRRTQRADLWFVLRYTR